MKIVSIVGARPQFVKAAALSRELRKKHEEILVHTGQHYDYEMSGIFFDGMGIPAPDINLAVGSGSHGAQTGAMLEGIEKLLLVERPDWLLIYGDTNSTLAGALAGAKLHVPVVHVEAGLRSFNRHMPEEINRVVADHLSALLLCPSKTAIANLQAEGITRGVHEVGDVMLDVLNWARQRITENPARILNDIGVSHKGYLLTTIHRSESTDDVKVLSDILGTLNTLDERVVFPIHPRARKAIKDAGIHLNQNISAIEPVGYTDMVALASNARLILTDSGGLQKEAYWLRVPCLTLRNETEWVETVDAGWNLLVGHDPQTITNAARTFDPKCPHPSLYGEGTAAINCVQLLN